MLRAGYEPTGLKESQGDRLGRCSRYRGAAEITSERTKSKSDRTMKLAPPLLPLLLGLLSQTLGLHGLCTLENGTAARCHELGDVKYIETYDLESLKAPISDTVLRPGLFANLTSLRHLDLSGGGLQRIEPESFRALSGLRSLDLSDNRLEYLELASLDGLGQLRSLNLRRNELRLLPPALARLKNLQHLDIQGNPLQCGCATLRVRDLISKRGAKISKKVICAGPSGSKGGSLTKLDAGIICAFEEQDREMQRDQAYEGSAEGSADDGLEDFDEEFTEAPAESSTILPKEAEIETPFPEIAESTTTMATTEATESGTILENISDHVTVTESLYKESSEEEEIFFDTDDKRGSTVRATTEKKEEVKDSLFYPVECSGDGEEGSGEGSGIDIGEGFPEEDTESTDSGQTLLGRLWNVLFSTEAPEAEKEPDLEEEQFIVASPTKETEEEVIVPKKATTVMKESERSTEATPATSSTSSSIELLEGKAVDEAKSGRVKVDELEDNDELAEVSPARQSKKGMGSYVVLAALLAILAALIGFAAYKGDFCRKKRKRGDVENGTELKDMQKALLENSTQPKIASNGTPESVPLVDGTLEEPKDSRDSHSRGDELEDVGNAASEQLDPVKPPRKILGANEEPRAEEKQDSSSSSKEDRRSVRTASPSAASTQANNGPVPHMADSNGPPLSPGAQRVKITLQENPDSVPKTPILITRTMAGENLVKTP
ncbi:hypothetical protein KM043_007496 [Ampulex compressa]|nr:hypothetical protein KM043_007496 [Ampulex compressa]